MASRDASKLISSEFYLNAKRDLLRGIRNNKQFVIAAIVILSVAAIGVVLITLSRAATPLVQVEPESGTISGPVTIVSDANASGGKYVKLGGASTGTCTVDAKLVNSCRPWLSAAAGYYTNVGGAYDSSIQFPYFEKRLNNPEALSDPNVATTITHKLDFIHTYGGYGDTLSTWEKSMINRANTYLLYNWKAAPTSANSWILADGRDATVNANIDKMANSLKSVAPKKVMVAVWHEPENDVKPNVGATCNPSNGDNGTTAEYRAMWQNVRNRFDALGVNNVIWVMNYMGFSNYNCIVSQLWPGNDLVDWIMYDPYDGGTATYATSISPFYTFLSNNSNTANDYLSKPWGLAEFGYWNKDGNSTPTEAVKYWQQAKTSLETNQFPRLKMYAVFDSSPSGNLQTSAHVGLQFNSTFTIDKNEQTAYNTFAQYLLSIKR
jgi:hypothetical protein